MILTGSKSSAFQQEQQSRLTLTWVLLQVSGIQQTAHVSTQKACFTYLQLGTLLLQVR